MMGRFMVLLTAFIATLAVATVSGAKIISAIERQSTTTTYSMKVGSLTRQYEVIAPTATLAKSAPIIVVLAGAAATISMEITRDQMVPYANADKAEIVYPVPIKESWNAIGCCDGAGRSIRWWPIHTTGRASPDAVTARSPTARSSTATSPHVVLMRVPEAKQTGSVMSNWSPF